MHINLSINKCVLYTNAPNAQVIVCVTWCESQYDIIINPWECLDDFVALWCRSTYWGGTSDWMLHAGHMLCNLALARSLQRTLTELKEYQQRHELWQIQQEKLQTEQASSDIKFEQRVAYEEHKVRQMTARVG